MTRLNLISPLSPGAQAAEADQGAIEIINGYVDRLSGTPVIKTRPGLLLKDTLDETVRVDTYWWEAKKVLILVCGARIYYKTSLGATPIEITPIATGDRISYNAKVHFSADEYGVTMTTGLGMNWWNGVSANAIKIVDANAPSLISGITYLKGYTIAAETNTQSFAWATYGPTDSRTAPPPWSAIRLSASSQPDDLVALASGWEELFLLGRESTESQYVTGDAIVPFQSLAGSAGDKGIINNKVLNKLMNAWVYFTPNRQVVMMQGRSPMVISDPIDYILQEMDNFDDVESFVLFERFYVLNFRSENTTFVFDGKMKLWYRWEYWDRTYKKYVKYLGVTSAHAKAWGKHMVGGFDGKLYVAEYNQVTDNDNLIRGKILSAHIDHGSLDRKFVNEVKLRIRRGY